MLSGRIPSDWRSPSFLLILMGFFFNLGASIKKLFPFLVPSETPSIHLVNVGGFPPGLR